MSSDKRCVVEAATARNGSKLSCTEEALADAAENNVFFWSWFLVLKYCTFEQQAADAYDIRAAFDANSSTVSLPCK